MSDLDKEQLLKKINKFISDYFQANPKIHDLYKDIEVAQARLYDCFNTLERVKNLMQGAKENESQ